MSAERGLSLDEELDRAVLLERLRRVRAARRASVAPHPPGARPARGEPGARAEHRDAPSADD